MSVVGARMRPGAAPALLGVDAAALRDGSVMLAAVWGDAAGRLEERLEDAGEHRVALLLAALHACALRAEPPDPTAARWPAFRRRRSCELSVSYETATARCGRITA